MKRFWILSPNIFNIKWTWSSLFMASASLLLKALSNTLAFTKCANDDDGSFAFSVWTETTSSRPERNLKLCKMVISFNCYFIHKITILIMVNLFVNFLFKCVPRPNWTNISPFFHTNFIGCRNWFGRIACWISVV